MRASRPRFAPGYGIAASEEGLLAWDWAVEKLKASRNYWISTTRADGRPHAMPVWGVVMDDALWFGTSPESVKGRNLERTGQVVAHTESGDEVVILEGTAEQARTPTTVLDAYEEKYNFRPEPGPFWVVRPTAALAWREDDYPTSATRFVPD
jgi:hypothetical protein